MWMGSPSAGVLCFDGRHFDHFSPARLSVGKWQSTFAQLIFEDLKKNLWIGTNTGALMRLNRLSNEFELANDTIRSPRKPFYSVAVDIDGSFWLGSLGGGLVHFNPNTMHYRVYKADRMKEGLLPDDYVTGITFAFDKLWIATTNGLCSYDNLTDQFIRYPLNNANPTDTYRYRVIRDIKVSPSGKLYLATYGGLQIFDPQTLTSKHVLNPVAGTNSLFRIAEEKSGKLWMASFGGGLIGYNPSDGEFTQPLLGQPDLDGNSDMNLFSVYLDDTGLLWIGSNENTVSLLNTRDKPFDRLTHKASNPQSLSPGWVRCLFQENDSIYWLGFNGGGVNRVNLNNGYVTKFLHNPLDKTSLGYNQVTAIDRDSRGRIWVGLEGGGINMMNPGTSQFIRYEASKNGLKNNAVSTMLVDSDDLVWVCTFKDGLSVYNIRQNKFKSFNDDSLKKASGISFAFTRSIYQHKNNIWFCTNNQIIVFDKIRQQFVAISTTGSLNPDHQKVTIDMTPVSDEKMIIVNESGIRSIQYHAPARIEQKLLYRGSIDDNEVKSLVTDKLGNLWHATENQIVKWHLSKNKKKVFDKSDGLHGRMQKLFKDRQGRIIVLTTNGINWFNPTEVIEDTIPRTVEFAGLRIFNRPIAVNKFDSVSKFTLPVHMSKIKELNFNHNHSFITFNFNALEYFSPDKINYAYQLEGFDRDWIEVGNQNFASYTNLNAGRYQFKVKASSPDGHWPTNYAALLIFISPPFWQTWWFISTIIFIAVFVLVVLYRYRLEQILKVERLRTKIASDLHDEVGSSLTRISIYSDVIKNGEPEAMKAEHLSSIGTLSREVINTMSDIVWSIDSTYDTPDALAIRMKDMATEMLHSKNIELTFHEQEHTRTKSFEPIFRQNIYLIFKEAINNIVKHSNATHVNVSIVYRPQFYMIIEDDGVGIPDNVYSGNGLRNMKRRAQQAGGQLIVSTSQGTKIRFDMA